MITLLDICHVRPGAAYLAAADRFAREVIGLQPVRLECRARDIAQFRSKYP